MEQIDSKVEQLAQVTPEAVAQTAAALDPVKVAAIAEAQTAPKPQLPSLGRTVLYACTKEDADRINRRRVSTTDIRERMAHDDARKWPVGAQAHIGNYASEGTIYPAVVVAAWGGDCVNLKVLLDGNDDLWVTSCTSGTGPGTWAWPQRG